MKILFVMTWRGNINRASMRVFPSLKKTVSYAAQICKEEEPEKIKAFYANWVQAYEVFEDKPPKLVRDFKQQVVKEIQGQIV